MTQRPNFLFIITDQHRADHLGCYGNDVLRTPHIDSLAARGTRFDRFYVANPVCMPNRASLMTGRMPSVNGVRHNGLPLPLDQVTFVELLAAAGYHTGLVGKAHLQNFTSYDPVIGFETSPGRTPPPEALREADRRRLDGPEYDIEKEKQWADPSHDVPLPFYGFREARICTNHGDLVGADYRRWLEGKQPGASSLIGPEAAMPDQRRAAPQAWRTAVPEELYPTTYVKELTCDFLERRAAGGGDAPFFLQASFPDPHHPFTPPGKYWDMYDPDRIPLPSSFDRGDSAPLVWMRDQLAQGTVDRSGPTAAFAVTAAEARTIIALTYGMIAMVDDAVGEILATLDRLGLSEDTVVIFTADHGDFMGDHGIMLKYMLHYQGIIRVPCIIADPAADRAGTVRSDLASSIDLAPSILGRAGLQPYNGMQGRDLLDAAAPAPDGLIVEEDSAFRLYGNDTPDRVRTLVTDRWRLSYHQAGDWWELYDLTQDPDEIVNLWDSPQRPAVADELVRQMLSRLVALNDTSPLPTGRA